MTQIKKAGLLNLEVIRSNAEKAFTEQPEILTNQYNEAKSVRRIAYLVAVIRSLTERTPQDLVDDVNFEISKLEPLEFQDAVDNIKQTYNQAFFLTEYDVDYKVTLCRALLQFMRNKNARYENPLIEAIANRNPNVQDLIEPIYSTN